MSRRASRSMTTESPPRIVITADMLAEQLGVSRQRADQILNPTKHRARQQVSEAVKKGLLIRPGACSQCAASDVPIQAHHPDYAKPLEVLWLCTKCHGAAHRGRVHPRKGRTTIISDRPRRLRGTNNAHCSGCGEATPIEQLANMPVPTDTRPWQWYCDECRTDEKRKNLESDARYYQYWKEIEDTEKLVPIIGQPRALGREVKRARLELGLTEEEVGDKARIPEIDLRLIERGYHPSYAEKNRYQVKRESTYPSLLFLYRLAEALSPATSIARLAMAVYEIEIED